MKISVVIPTYNRAYIVGEALESALRQTYRDFEIVVVDDGSNDDTDLVISRMATSAVQYIRLPNNRGYSAACNTGVSAARGEYISFLDSDDIWRPDYLDRQQRFLAVHREVDAVFTDTEVQEGELKISSLRRQMKAFSCLLAKSGEDEEHVISCREMFLCLLEEVPIKPSALVVKKSLFEKFGGFNESWPCGTDWDLLLRFARLAQFGFIDHPLVIQRRTPDATHQVFREQDQLFLLSVFSREKALLRDDREAVSAVNRGILSGCNNLGFHYLISGRKIKSIMTYLWGFKETRDIMLLFRAAGAVAPIRIRSSVRKALAR
jgi:glycosyltransferase involved in cell wall biosynthesis